MDDIPIDNIQKVNISL